AFTLCDGELRQRSERCGRIGDLETAQVDSIVDVGGSDKEPDVGSLAKQQRVLDSEICGRNPKRSLGHSHAHTHKPHPMRVLTQGLADARPKMSSVPPPRRAEAVG